MHFSALLLASILHLTAFTCASNPKRGIGFSVNGQPADIQHAANTAITWEYSWQIAAPSTASGVTHVPMQWGSAGIAQLAQSVKAQNAKILLGFNEPERGDQSNLSPAAAAQLWKQYFEPLKSSGVSLGSPAISSAPAGKTWMTSFLSACTGCHIDFIAFHWYGDGAENFINYAHDLHTTFNKQLWCTEFASTTTDMNAQTSFMKDTLNFLDTTDYIGKYAWFDYGRVAASGLSSNLLGSDGNLNTLGKEYVQ